MAQFEAATEGAASRVGLARPARWLEGVTLAYVALPFVVFALGWLKPWIGLPTAAIVLYGAWRAARSEGGAEGRVLAGREWLVLLALLGGVLFLVFFSGAGGYAIQYSDYLRHNAFLRDLIERPWPVTYPRVPPNGEPGVLAFYIANSLPPAVVGKWLGWNAANHANFLWTALGFYLAICWFLRVIGRVSFRYGLLFAFFGGLDILGRVALLGWYADGSKMLSNWLVRYALSSTPEAKELMQGVFWMYPSNLNFIYYAPQHVLGPWLCALVLLYDALRGNTARRSVFLWSLVLLWSAFSFVGLLPFLALAILCTNRARLLSFENTIAAGTVLLLTGLYIGSNSQEYPHGFLWQKQEVLRTWPTLLLFYAVEFGIYAWLCPRVERESLRRLHRGWWWLSLACLLAAPWYVLGTYNDLTTKVSIPAMLVLQIWIATALMGARSDDARRRARVLVALLVVGAMASFADLARGLYHPVSVEPISLRHVRRANQLGPVAAQLFATGDGFFWRYVAREQVRP